MYVLKDIKHSFLSVDAMTIVKGQKEKCKIIILHIFALFCSNANLLLIQETLVLLLLMSKFAKLWNIIYYISASSYIFAQPGIKKGCALVNHENFIKYKCILLGTHIKADVKKTNSLMGLLQQKFLTFVSMLLVVTPFGLSGFLYSSLLLLLIFVLCAINRTICFVVL